VKFPNRHSLFDPPCTALNVGGRIHRQRTINLFVKIRVKAFQRFGRDDSAFDREMFRWKNLQWDMKAPFPPHGKMSFQKPFLKLPFINALFGGKNLQKIFVFFYVFLIVKL